MAYTTPAATAPGTPRTYETARPVADREAPAPTTKRQQAASANAAPRAGLPTVDDLLVRAARALAQGNSAEARGLVAQASLLDDTSIFLDFSPGADAASKGDLQNLQTLTLPDEVTSAWLDAYLDLSSGRFDELSLALSARDADLPPSLAYLAGLASMMTNDWEHAITYFDAVLVQQPGLLAPRLAKAVVELMRNRLAEGVAQLTAVRDRAPGEPIVSYLIGWAHLRRGDASAAIPHLERAAALAPEFDAVSLALAHAHNVAGDPSHAIETYATLIRRKPSLQPARARLGRLFKHLSDQVFFRLQELGDKSAEVPRSTMTALERRKKGYEESALVELAVAVQLDVNDIASTRQIGEILRRRNDLDQAQAIFESLLRRHPEEWLLYYRLGTVALARDNLPYAVTALTQALQLAPADGDSYQALGIALLRLGSPADAQTALIQGSLHEPFNPALHNNLGVARARTGRLDAAQQSFERALELGTFPLPRRYITHYNLALVHLALGDTEQARLSLQRALRARPDFQPAKNVMASVKSGGQSHLNPDYLLHDLLERFGEVSTVAQ